MRTTFPLLLCFAVGCGGSGSLSPTAPTAPPAAVVAPQAQLPSLAGTWRGSYVRFSDPSGSDGVLTLTLAQDGSDLTGQFRIVGDTLFGNVSGTLRGQVAPEATSRTAGFRSAGSRKATD